MAGAPFDDDYLPNEYNPSSSGGTGAKFSEDVRDNFAKLKLNDKEKDVNSRIFQSRRKISSAHPRIPPMRYEYLVFTKTEDWRVADMVQITAPQDELERKVAKGKKTHSVLEAMKKMSSERRAQITRLLSEKNLAKKHGDAEWQCVFIDSPSPRTKTVNGKTVREHLRMDVIIAQHILFDEVKASSPGRSMSFIGRRSDINEPLRPEEKATEKSKAKPYQAGKEAKSGKEEREDPLDRDRLFNEDGRPLDKNGPIPEYLPQQVPQEVPQQLPQQLPQHLPQHLPQQLPQQLPHHLPFNQGMGQPFGPQRGQHVGSSQPTGPAVNPVFGDPFAHPAPTSKLPHNIEILNDPLPPPNGANGVFPVHNLPPHEQGNMHPYPPPPQFQHPHVDNIHKAEARLGKAPNHPIIIQEAPKGRHHHKQRSVYDDSSRDSDDEGILSEDDERSSHTSYGDDHEKLPHRGSLAPQGRYSVKKGEKPQREHRRGSSYPIAPVRRIETPRRESRYTAGRERVETVVAGPTRPTRPTSHNSSREHREHIRYEQPRRLEYEARSPRLTPISNSSYSPPRRPPGLLYPHEMLDRERDDWERERRVEEYMRMDAIREREEAVRRREWELNDRELLDQSGGRL
jgi:hypothetical protein